MAHPRPPSGAASADRRPGFPAVGVDAGLPGRARVERRAVRRDRPRDDLLLHRPERADVVQRTLQGAGRRGPEVAAAAAGTAWRLCGAAQVGGAADQDRRRRAALVADPRRVPAGGDGHDSADRAGRHRRRRRRLVGGRRNLSMRAWPMHSPASPSPTASSTTTRWRRRSGCGRCWRTGGRRQASSRCWRRPSTPSCRTNGIAMCRKGFECVSA